MTALFKKCHALKDRVDAINVPDCQRAILKMSSLATSKLIEEETGIETIWQLTGRDRNLLALQADLMGGYALGLRNVLALTGDPVQIGDHRNVAQQVSHLDALKLLDLIRTLNAGTNAVQQDLKHGGTNFTVGSALNPFNLKSPAQRQRLEQKIQLGTQFFQTQPIYNDVMIEQLHQTVQQAAHNVGLPVPKILIGIVPPKSAQFARFMNQSLPGVNIPNEFIELLEKSDNPTIESIHYCGELVNTLKPHCDGFHFMPVSMENKVSLLLDACFLPV